VHDLGLEDWIFWHPTSKYGQIEGAFARDESPRARAFTATPIMTAAVDRFDRESAAAIRERLAARAAGAPARASTGALGQE
jgi:hypothetical protein